MAEAKNPLTAQVQKMAAVLEAAKKVGKKAEEEKAKEGQGGKGQSGQKD